MGLLHTCVRPSLFLTQQGSLLGCLQLERRVLLHPLTKLLLHLGDSLQTNHACGQGVASRCAVPTALCARLSHRHTCFSASHRRSTVAWQTITSSLAMAFTTSCSCSANSLARCAHTRASCSAHRTVRLACFNPCTLPLSGVQGQQHAHLCRAARFFMLQRESRTMDAHPFFKIFFPHGQHLSQRNELRDTCAPQAPQAGIATCASPQTRLTMHANPAAKSSC